MNKQKKFQMETKHNFPGNEISENTVNDWQYLEIGFAFVNLGFALIASITHSGL